MTKDEIIAMDKTYLFDIIPDSSFIDLYSKDITKRKRMIALLRGMDKYEFEKYLIAYSAWKLFHRFTEDVIAAFWSRAKKHRLNYIDPFKISK